MKVILKQDIPNLGRSGDIKEVKNGYARNYLLPNNLVMSATAKTAKQQLFLEQVQQRKIAKRKKTAQELAHTLRNKEIHVTAKTGEGGKLFGSVTNLHVQKALETEGFLVDKKIIQIDEPIKELGEYLVVIKLYDGIETNIKLFVQDEDGNITIPQEAITKENSSEKTETNSATEESSVTEAPVAEEVSEKSQEKSEQ